MRPPHREEDLAALLRARALRKGALEERERGVGRTARQGVRRGVAELPDRLGIALGEARHDLRRDRLELAAVCARSRAARAWSAARSVVCMSL